MLPASCRLLSHPNDDLVYPEGQHHAGTRAFQMHDHAGVVLQTTNRCCPTGSNRLCGALRVPTGKIGDAGELVDGAGGADFPNPADRAHNTAKHLCRVAAFIASAS